MHTKTSQYLGDEMGNKNLSPIGAYWQHSLLPLKEALQPVMSHIDGLDRSIKVAMEHCCQQSKHELTKEESAAIYLYTMEGGDNSFYRIINELLRSENRHVLPPWFGFLKLFDTALNKLPTVRKPVWRGIANDIGKQFNTDEKLTWWSISSCSTDVKVAQDFLISPTNITLLMIETKNAKDISEYTSRPNEKEVLLGPGTQLRVVSSALLPGGLYIVHLIEEYDGNKEPLSNAMIPMKLTTETERIEQPASSSTSTASVVKSASSTLSLQAPVMNLHSNTKWVENGVTVTGQNSAGDGINQLDRPWGLHINDKNQTIYVADSSNHRIVELKYDGTGGRVIAGKRGLIFRTNALCRPTDVTFDRQGDSLIICDTKKRRVVRWFHQNDTSGEEIISDIDCISLTMDEDGFLYVVDYIKHQVIRCRTNDTQKKVVAGGHGQGSSLNQLSTPQFVYVDRDRSVYVSDWGNHRVMKWKKDATEGIVVAGGKRHGHSLEQLNGPEGIIVDQWGTVYISDSQNHRIMRWPKDATKGSVIAGGKGRGSLPNQFNYPYGLSFDRDGNLYVVDQVNHRIQKFSIE